MGTTGGARSHVVTRLLALATAWVFTLAYWLVFLLLFAGLRPAWSHAAINRVIRAWGRAVLAILGIELLARNASTLEGARARVVVCNHQSALDLVWGAAIAPANITVLGKRELMWIPIINLAWWALGFVFVDRRNPQALVAALGRIAARVQREGRSLVVAPEGTRSPDGMLLPFKSGAFRIAMAGGIPVYPVVVQGAHDLMPKGALLPRPGQVLVQYLPPVSTQAWTRATLSADMAAVRQAMAAALGELSR